MIRAVLFDYGGVLAEEGFREGLKAIARSNRRDPEAFYAVAAELVYATGYVLGSAGEADYWYAVRTATGITAPDADLRKEILDRFVLRPDVIDLAGNVRAKGYTTGILSDQTDWLEELDRRDQFFRHFDHVFNSYRLNKGKRDASLFTDVCAALGVAPGETVFIDDNAGNIERAQKKGLHGILYENVGQVRRDLDTLLAKEGPEAYPA